MKQKNFYYYANILVWPLVLFLIGDYVFGWTNFTKSSLRENVVLETGATPAGSSGYIQFNDAGNLGNEITIPGTAKLTIAAGVLNMTTQKITNLATPTDDSDSETKGYVDAASGYSICTIRYYSSNCPTGFTKVAEKNTSFNKNAADSDYWSFGADHLYRFYTSANDTDGYAGLFINGGQYTIYSWNVNGTETHYFCCY
ncbi:MAG: hypothetical protein WC306_00295 [Candidatus Paceibacterota bacterium]|jgi:hypothetical protein